jgi:Na+/phosphate symporter
MEEARMADKTSQIGEIVEVMLNTWDLPADCNEGELFTYAETLYDRIAAGDSKDELYAYLSEVQTDHLELAKSDAFRAIVDRAVGLSKAAT